MAFFALLWKARTIEKYRINYEKEKINSIVLGQTRMEQTLSQRWRHYSNDTKKRISRTFKRWYPEGSGVANFFIYMKTDQTFANFLFKSVMGFVGGIILTYLCFMFFVFQLSISLMHATIMSSIIGVLLTLGLAFSYRIRCLVFLLIPQFFSRVGRYTLTCYALVLILTGPATNTLKNSEVLSESMACSQEHIKTSVHQLNDLMKKPFNALKDSIKLMIDRLKMITAKVKETVIRIDRLVMSIVSVIQSSFSWLQSVTDICNDNLGTPFERCQTAMKDGVSDCEKTLGPDLSGMCNVVYVAQAACYSVQPFHAFCFASDFMDEAILANVKKKIRNFSEHLRAMFHVEVHIHHAYSFSSNTSRSASQVAAGIVTEIRNRADPLLTWLSWSSCVTSLFLLLIIFRAKYYQHMYETRSRFDNRYVTKELQELDLKRQRQGRETVLPLNRRERAKYITTTSFRLVASEKVYLNRSAVFMAITTFKLLIHMVADYSLYWVLMTIRYHGRYQSDLMPGIPHSGVHVSGKGFVARLFRSIVSILDIPLASPAPSAISCLPDPYPPDLRRYTQIGVLIFLLWFFALFEPYGLRLRHLIMGHYRPERAKARATWLYNHILRTRAGFMKFARRKLHRDYKYSSESALTFRQWITDRIPFQCCRSLLGFGPKELHCLLCGTTSSSKDPDSKLTRCQTPGCPGTFCISCFTDIGELCTICLSPADYGDLSDVSLEKGSSDDSDSDGEWAGKVMPTEYMIQLKNIPFQWREAPKYEFCNRSDISCNRRPSDRCMKLFGPISRLVPEKVYAKRALERFRNKVNTIDTLPSSLVQKMMSTINAVRDKSPPKYDSPICLSKRASFYRAFNKDLIQGSDIIDTDMLFKNENYFDDRIDDAFDTTGNSKFTISNPLVGKELIISRSSDEKTSKPRVTRRCKCDLYEDLQRKWTHVKKSLSDKGSMISKKLHLKNPLSMMKNFCSSLFGPSCTTDTCPNKRDKESKAKRDKDSKKTKSKKDKKGQIGTQTNERKPKGRMGQASIQTQSQKNTETQLASDVDIEKQIEIEEEIYLEREKEKQRIKEQEKEKERNRMEIEKLQMERERQENEKEKIGKDIQEKAETKDKCAEEQIKLEKCKEEQRRTEAYNSGDTDKTGSKDSKKKGMSDRQNTTKDREMMNKGIYATPEMATGACQAIDCPNYCHRSVQYDKRDAKQAKNMKSKGVGSVKCVCDEAVQGSKQKTLCTCATQHVSDQKKAGTPKASPVMVRSFTLNQDSPVDGKNMQQKRGRHNDISKREPQKLSLENEICMLDRSAKLAKAMQDVLSDSLTNNSSLSSLCSEVEQSARSDETRTDTTICSLATFDDQPRRRKFRVKVITKTNQATLTDKTRLCDTGTITNDWWSPIVERKARDEILLEKKKGFNAIEQQKKQLKELKEWKELREVRKRRRNCGVTTDGRIVTFRSRTQIIPTGLFPGPNDIMSPSRYLLESQKYYNELFSYNFRPPQVDYTCLTAQSHPKYQEKEKTRSPLGSRRNHHRKTKRLDECYSPRRQLPPRKRHTESIKTSDSPRRKSYAHRHTSTRHHTKYLSPRKRY